MTKIPNRRANHTRDIDTQVGKEVLVLSREKCVDDADRYGLEKYNDPSLASVLRYQCAICRMNPCRFRQLARRAKTAALPPAAAY